MDTLRKAKLNDVAQLRLYVRKHGEVPPSGKLSKAIGQTRQRVVRRWDGDWDALYAAAGHKRPEGRGRWRKGRDLTEEHKQKISDAIRAHWKQRKQETEG